MIQAIVASFPVESIFVPGFLENIIDKRVSGVALNALERFVDWLCSWLYCFYNTLLMHKMGRVHFFNDRDVKLFDCTREGIANIDPDFENDFITLRENKVYFMGRYCKMLFEHTNLEYVIVKDDPMRREGWYQIVLQPIPFQGDPMPPGVKWKVNTKLEQRFAPDEISYLAVPQEEAYEYSNPVQKVV